MTVICDDNMMIEGIFTDGDLRRVFDMGVDVRQLSISDVMTPGEYVCALAFWPLRH